MTQKRFTVIRKKNQVSKEMGNYVQDRGTTILKLGFLEDCKDVCDILNELSEENEQLKKEKDYYKRELQKELVCQAIIDRREKND